MKNRYGGLSGIGGWLYADLLLVLFIGVLSSTPTQAQLKQMRGAVVAPTAAAMPAAASEQSLSPRSVRFVVPIAKSLSISSSVEEQVNFRRRVRASLMRELVSAGFPPNARIGMVLAFGGAKGSSGALGADTARRAQEILQQTLDDELTNRFRSASFEKFHNLNLQPGNVALWVYVYVN